jgi:hypothetical protein
LGDDGRRGALAADLRGSGKIDQASLGTIAFGSA